MITKVNEKWAVIIGISKYQDSSLNLKYADKDAQEFYDILTQSKEGFFKANHVEKLINEQASMENILWCTQEIFKKTR